MKILLVEDHPAVGPITRNLLQLRYKYEVLLAATAGDALHALDHFQPGLVLTDVNLPDFDGYELAARLRARPQFAEVVIVAVSGIGNFIDQARAAESGIDACFTKPMDFELLKDIKRAAD